MQNDLDHLLRRMGYAQQKYAQKAMRERIRYLIGAKLGVGSALSMLYGARRQHNLPTRTNELGFYLRRLQYEQAQQRS